MCMGDDARDAEKVDEGTYSKFKTIIIIILNERTINKQKDT
jgi:hypothetical protein